jgi:hypothetical protein
MNYSHPSLSSSQSAEALRLEYVTTCVGFDDLLDHTLAINHPHGDTALVVTSPEDRATPVAAAQEPSAGPVEADAAPECAEAGRSPGEDACACRGNTYSR